MKLQHYLLNNDVVFWYRVKVIKEIKCSTSEFFIPERSKSCGNTRQHNEIIQKYVKPKVGRLGNSKNMQCRLHSIYRWDRIPKTQAHIEYNSANNMTNLANLETKAINDNRMISIFRLDNDLWRIWESFTTTSLESNQSRKISLHNLE